MKDWSTDSPWVTLSIYRSTLLIYPIHPGSLYRFTDLPFPIYRSTPGHLFDLPPAISIYLDLPRVTCRFTPTYPDLPRSTFDLPRFTLGHFIDLPIYLIDLPDSPRVTLSIYRSTFSDLPIHPGSLCRSTDLPYRSTWFTLGQFFDLLYRFTCTTWTIFELPSLTLFPTFFFVLSFFFPFLLLYSSFFPPSLYLFFFSSSSFFPPSSSPSSSLLLPLIPYSFSYFMQGSISQLYALRRRSGLEARMCVTLVTHVLAYNVHLNSILDNQLTATSVWKLFTIPGAHKQLCLTWPPHTLNFGFECVLLFRPGFEVEFCIRINIVVLVYWWSVTYTELKTHRILEKSR